MKTPLFTILCCFLFSVQVHATHNVAGEITYRQLTNQIIECTITTYTVISSVDADRDTLTLNWGDGQVQRVARVNGPGGGVPQGEDLGNGFKMNKYTAVHTYEALGSYVLSMEDPNRNAGILNVNFPNSVSVPFYIQTEIELSADFNNSPRLLNPPIDFAFTGEPFLHTPNAFDIDGDSIAYRLVTPLQGMSDVVPNYMPLGDEENFNLDEETGLITWLSPNQAGSYTIAIEVSSYRNGQVVNRLIRDMQITVEDGGNSIPILMSNSSYSQSEVNTVMVGETVNIEVSSIDMDDLQLIQLSSNSGLYDFFDNPATFTITEENGNVGAAVFNWTPTSEHIREQSYQLVIKSSDDLGLANYLVFRFKVVGVTSSENLVPAQDIGIYPNPVATVLHLDSAEKLSGYYQIYDIRGRLLQSGKLDNASKMQVENLPAGQYYLRLNERPALPFVKQ